MLCLITGGVKNGKSGFGEDLCRSFSGGRLCYVATMYRDPGDAETELRIKRHRETRKDKGFDTIERPCDIAGISADGYDAALLECLPNLLANEMFMRGMDGAAGRVMDGLRALLRSVGNLVVITNEIGSDGIIYPKETEDYLYALGDINRRLADGADRVYELVCGIPMRIK